jgi:hypothetical protein
MSHDWTKDPQAARRYTFDWVELTGQPVTDAVQSATITVTPAGVTAGPGVVDPSGRYVQTLLSGGAHGTRYGVKCAVVTVGGQSDEHTQDLLVLDE